MTSLQSSAHKLLKQTAVENDTPIAFWATLLNKANGNVSSITDLFSLAGFENHDIIHVYNSLKF